MNQKISFLIIEPISGTIWFTLL